LIDFVRAHDRGLIRHDAALDLAWCLVQIAEKFREATMAIICRTKRNAAVLAARIRTYSKILDERLEDGDNLIDRVRVGVPLDFADDDFAISRRHILIFAEAQFAIREAALDIFPNRSNRFRLFGFIGRDTTFAITDEAYLRGT